MPSSPRAEVPFVPPTIQQEIARLAGSPEIRAAFAWLRAEEAQFAAWQLEMARIPAPPFGETARGEWLGERFRALELGSTCVSRATASTGLEFPITELEPPQCWRWQPRFAHPK